MKKSLICLVLLLFLSPLFAQDQPDFPNIYVDEGCAGTKVGSQANPYDDLSDINWTTGGDNSIFDYLAGAPSQSPTINLNKSDTWRETMTIGTSGTATYPIIIQAYGAGDDPKIYGSIEVVIWTDRSGEGANLWSAEYGSDPNDIWYITTSDVVMWGQEEGVKGNLNAEYEWWWDAGNTRIYVYAATTPDTRYDAIEAPDRYNCIVAASKDYITIQNLELGFTERQIIKNASGDNWLIDSNIIHAVRSGPYGDGVQILGGSDCTISNNTISEIGTHGVYLLAQAADENTDDNIVEHNIFFNCYHNFVDNMSLAGALSNDGNIIRYNLGYWDDNYDVSVSCNAWYVQGHQTGPVYVTNTEIYYNIIYNFPTNGAHVAKYATGIEIYNNVFYKSYAGTGHWSAGVNIADDSGISGIIIKNNIAVDCASRCLYVRYSANVSSCENNLWYNTSGTFFTAVDGTSYDAGDQAAYKAATTWDDVGLWEDPSFVNQANADFHLASDSNCIEAGVDVSLPEDFDGVSVPQGTFPEMGAYEYQGAILRIRDILRIRNVLRIK